MKFDKFIADYDTAGNKDQFLKERIKTKYVSYCKKVSECQRIIDSSMYVSINEERVFRVNSPAQYVLFVLCIIENYTDIEINFEDSIGCYDELNKRGTVEKIIKNIPDREYGEFRTILDMMSDDLYKNERSLVSYLDNKLSATVLGLSEIVNQISKVRTVQDEE